MKKNLEQSMGKLNHYKKSHENFTINIKLINSHKDPVERKPI